MISVAEESDLIVLLGEWVLVQALADNPGGTLGVNVSVRELVRPNFSDVVGRALHRAHIQPEQLCIEVTETSLATALNTSYMADRLGLFGIVVGVALLLSGIGFIVLAFAALHRKRDAELA